MNNSMWNKKWNEDISVLKNTLKNKHKNLFFNITKEEFEENIQNLNYIIDKLDYNDMKVEISRIIASIGDAHTTVKLPINYIIPLEFYWFKEGIYVVNTCEEYNELMYCKVVSINDNPIEDVIEELKLIISYENNWYLKSNLIKFIQCVEILYGLMIIDNIENCNIKFETLNGEFKSRSIKSIDISSFNKIFQKVNNEKVPLYRKKHNKNYWFEFIEKEEILYFKYNACRISEDEPIETFINNIITFIENNNVKKLVVDFRNNNGGDSRLLEKFIQYIEQNKTINQKGNLFVVIGRETFSSALLNAFFFKSKTKAILIGEPTGGKPNCYGEIEKFNLPNSKFIITYSTEYYKLIEDDDIKSLYPDIHIEMRIYDFVAKKDRVLEKIKELNNYK